ncbi:MAG: thioredoxin [Ruminococcaceae bacterium]|jgi:thioredoxin 1|nr:thioredoxin [Oscillospiraceae bacterium]
MAELTITAQNFEAEVLQSPLPVLLDFWATWCPPCRALGPIVAEVAEELEGSIRVGKVNIDEEPALAARFGIASIPTLLVFKNGTIAGQSIGLQGKQQIIDLLAL